MTESNLAEVLAAVATDFGINLEAIYRAVDTGWRGSSARKVAEFFAQHPEVLTTLQVAASPEYRERTCHCFCQWRHVGVCTTTAQVNQVVRGELVPFCASCADALDLSRSVVQLGEIELLPPQIALGPWGREH